jgi:hypothetical protein
VRIFPENINFCQLFGCFCCASILPLTSSICGGEGTHKLGHCRLTSSMFEKEKDAGSKNNNKKLKTSGENCAPNSIKVNGNLQ